MKKNLILLTLLTLSGCGLTAQTCTDCNASHMPKVLNPQQAIYSIDTGYTVTKVRSAKKRSTSYLIASTYEGTILALNYDGTQRWENALSGLMNHDVWVADINQDGDDEILVANADGSIYALNSVGQLLWRFKQNDVPMNAVTLVNKDNEAFIVCGGYDTNLYYLDTAGQLVKTIKSEEYSIAKVPSHSEKPLPKPKRHSINFLKPVKQSDGSELLAVIGTNNTMQTSGDLYLFTPLSNKPISKQKLTHKKAVGELRIADINQDGVQDLLIGNSSMVGEASINTLDGKTKKQKSFALKKLQKQFDRNGYRVVQSEAVELDQQTQLLTLFGARLILSDTNLSPNSFKVLKNNYAYYDLWQPKPNQIVLASAQSGGSQIHVLNLNHKNWQQAYQALKPEGKLAKIIENTNKIKQQLTVYKPNSNYQKSRTVTLMSESQKDKTVKNKIAELKHVNPENPVFLNTYYVQKAENWDRSSFGNSVYEKKRDRRKKYTLTQEQILNNYRPLYQGDSPGASFWAGHGNDPLFYSLDTNKKILDLAKGKKTILVFPELEKSDDNFKYVMDNFLYPLAADAQQKNAGIYVRTKHTFWQAYIYKPLWSRLVSGEFSDVFIPSMEETTDKSMELSIAGRVGIWAAGSVDKWGARSARDNPSFDRTRQFSHQMLPNHFLRQMVYNIANGATEINNHPVDQAYMSVLWDLIAKGALYAPKREDMLHISPVHLSIIKPDPRYLNEGHNVKWTSFYNHETEQKSPMVFSRLNGTWPGAANTQWDFSTYAAGVLDRRQNFLPPYENGLVLITPPQQGAETQPRGLLKHKLHPIYEDILTEYITDGRYYYSADMNHRYSADEYYTRIASEIKQKSKLLPLTVEGGVAWTLAQTSKTNLRLTLIDSGYLNPNNRVAKININTKKIKSFTDILNKESFTFDKHNILEIPVEVGSFRFIDITLAEPL